MIDARRHGVFIGGCQEIAERLEGLTGAISVRISPMDDDHHLPVRVCLGEFAWRGEVFAAILQTSPGSKEVSVRSSSCNILFESKEVRWYEIGKTVQKLLEIKIRTKAEELTALVQKLQENEY